MKKICIVISAALILLCSACKAEEPSRLAEGSTEFTAETLPVIAVTELTESIGINAVTAILGVTRDEAEKLLTVCETTDMCYEKLIKGDCDIVLAHSYGKIAEEAIKSTALSFTETELKRDALVFITNGKHAPDSLSVDVLKRIYGGESANWAETGGEDAPIVLFASPDGTAAKNAFENYISKDISVPDVLKTVETADGTFTCAVGYDNRDGAVGYTLYSLLGNCDGGSVKPVKVDGIAPSEETVSSGEYPFTLSVNVTVRASEPSGQSVRIIYDWLISEQGRAAVIGSEV